MGRWEDNAVGRLQDAALELYRDPGYDQVTVAQIAKRAGLTRRTFFRYFSDQREVLFFGSDQLVTFVARAVEAAPQGLPGLEVVARALGAAGQRSDTDLAFADFARRRHALIRTYPDLRERDLTKLASLAAAAASALRRRGVADPAATLVAEAGVAAFKVAFEQWVDDPRRRRMAYHLREAMRGLRALVLEQGAKPGR